ncbi:MAG: histidine kinase [Candidatus Nanopelagicales bacterium]
MSRWRRWRAWTKAHPLFFDSCLALVLLVGGLLSLGPGNDGSRGPDGHPIVFEPTAASYILLVLACLVLVARRLRPVEVLGAELVLSLVGIAVDHSNSQTFGALFVAVYTVSMLRAWREAVGASAVVGLLICGSLWVVAADEVEKQVVYVFAALIAAACAIGIARRARRQVILDAEERALRAEQSREEEARRQVTEERLRIARELHDVLAHHIAVINVQSGVAQHLLATDPAKAGEAIGHVREASQVALSEMTTVLGLLRAPDESSATQPAPGLAQADALVESVRRAGVPVTWRVTGAVRPLAPVTDLAAYRVVQEALTNAGKHGRGGAEVLVDYRDDVVVLDISNRVAGEIARAGTGLGLVGMQERVTAVGGTLETGESDGRFLVHAELPAPPVPAMVTT